MPDLNEEYLASLQGDGPETGEVPCKFITGAAGTGKTHLMRERISADPSYAKMCATTGIAAVNLDTVTVNSVLGYFDTDSMEESFLNGWLQSRLLKLAEGSEDAEGNPTVAYRNLGIDEISMMAAEQLDMLHRSASQINERRDWRGGAPLGIILTGDFCQLPPIKAKWAFQADCWSNFAANTERLTKVWRQQNPQFLQGINLIRSGKGREGVDALVAAGVCFKPVASSTFDGTTIIAKNDAVDSFNWLAHKRVIGDVHQHKPQRWGKQRAEWIRHIPELVELKAHEGGTGAYVMVLTNDTPIFSYVNGDCGHLEAVEDNGRTWVVKLVRNGEFVGISPIVRLNTQRHAPEELSMKHPGESEANLRKMYRREDDGGTWPGHPYFSKKSRRWVSGGIRYLPLRLAYASTVHKTQGLSLDKVQLDCYNHFMSAPAMTYVALSRARSPEGLQIIGTPAEFAKKVKMHPEVLQWL